MIKYPVLLFLIYGNICSPIITGFSRATSCILHQERELFACICEETKNCELLIQNKILRTLYSRDFLTVLICPYLLATRKLSKKLLNLAASSFTFFLIMHQNYQLILTVLVQYSVQAPPVLLPLETNEQSSKQFI